MATKYIIEGAQYNGDGTTNAEAASAGAAGAWNHIDILTGTAVGYGSIAAGDIIKIRSKKSSYAGGGDLTISFSVATSVGSSNASTSGTVTWILDDGTEWAGNNGTLTVTATSSNAITLRPYNRFVALTNNNFIFVASATVPANFWLISSAGCLTKGIKMDTTAKTTTGNYGAIKSSGNNVHIDLYVTTSYPAGSSSGFSQLQSNEGDVLYINPSIEIANASTNPIFGHAGYGGMTTVRGGRLYGAGITSTSVLLIAPTSISNYHFFQSTGFQVPKEVNLPTISYQDCTVEMFGLDGGSGGAISRIWGQADSRNIDNNYPYLNATLNDSGATPVTWRLRPTGASSYQWWNMPIIKLYTSTAATKTVTLELLLASSGSWDASATKDNVWVDVCYIDNTTGYPKNISSKVFGGGSLDSSSASWNTTSWGAVSFNKYKIAVTTPTTIKQDTAITVSFCGSLNSPDAATKMVMFDPDVQLT